MRILHFGDIHVWRLALAPDFWYLKRILGTVNLTMRRRHRFPPHYPAIVAREIAETDGIDLVIFSGDMTTMSLASEFAEAARLFEPIFERWGSCFFGIPGNHDRYSPGSVKARLCERVFPYMEFPDGNLVRTQELTDTVSIVGFDCSHPCRIRSNGTMTALLEMELEQALKEQQSAGKDVLLTGHYPLQYPSDVHAAWEHKLLQAERLRRLILEYQPIAYFHGHKHQRWLEPVGERTVCVNCGAAGMLSPNDDTKQAGFLILELDEEKKLLNRVDARVLDYGTESFRTVPMELPKR